MAGGNGKTGIIVMDMWDHYPCKPAEVRIDQIASRIDTMLLEVIRKEDIIIAFCPSDIGLENIKTGKKTPDGGDILKYKDSEAYKRSEAYNLPGVNPQEISDLDTIAIRARFHRYKTDSKGSWIPARWTVYETIDECDCHTDDGERPLDVHPWLQKYVYQGENTPNDEQELYQEFQKRGILSNNNCSIVRYMASQGVKQAYIVGVHANMCFFSRISGVLYLLKYGINPVIVKDMTDTRLTRFQYPFKEHFDANEEFFSYIQNEIDRKDLIQRLNNYQMPYKDSLLPSVLDDSLKIQVAESSALGISLRPLKFKNDNRLSPSCGDKTGLTLENDEWGKERPMFPRGMVLYTDEKGITGIKVCYLDKPGSSGAKEIMIGSASGKAEPAWEFPLGNCIIKVLVKVKDGLRGMQIIMSSGKSYQYGNLDGSSPGLYKFECDRHHGIVSLIGRKDGNRLSGLCFRQTPYNTFSIIRSGDDFKYHESVINIQITGIGDCTVLFFEGAFYVYYKGSFMEKKDSIWLYPGYTDDYTLNAFQLAMNRGERDESGSKDKLQNWEFPKETEGCNHNGIWKKDIVHEKRDWYLFHSWNHSPFFMQWDREPEDGVSVVNKTISRAKGVMLTEQQEWPEEAPLNECGTILEGPVCLVGYSLNIQGPFGLNIHLALDEDIAADETAYLSITSEDGAVSRIDVRDARIRQGRRFQEHVFLCETAAKEMSRNISAQLFYHNGTEQSEVYTNTVCACAASWRERPETSEHMRELLKTLLNYGGYAQSYFDFCIDEPANGCLEEAERQLPDTGPLCLDLGYDKDEVHDITGITYEGASLIMGSELTVRHYFETQEGADITKYEFRCESSGGRTLEAAACGSNYRLDVGGIGAGDFDQLCRISVIYEGATRDFITYSPVSYLKAVLENSDTDKKLKDLVKALYCYYRNCREYLKIM